MSKRLKRQKKTYSGCQRGAGTFFLCIKATGKQKIATFYCDYYFFFVFLLQKVRTSFSLNALSYDSQVR
jgi:hypothetical protein